MSPLPGQRTTPYVICVGVSPDETAAIASCLSGRAVVMLAPDSAAIRELLDDDPVVPTGDLAQTGIAQEVIWAGQLRIDPRDRQVTWGALHIELSAREFDLLGTLALDVGRVWTFEELVAKVWKTHYLGDPEMVVSAVKRLRRRLGVADGVSIVSVRGIGFRLAVPDRTAAVTALPRQTAVPGAAGSGRNGESAVTLPA